MKYEFKCTKCGKTMELSMSVSDFQKMKKPICCNEKMGMVFGKPIVRSAGIPSGNNHQGWH